MPTHGRTHLGNTQPALRRAVSCCWAFLRECFVFVCFLVGVMVCVWALMHTADAKGDTHATTARPAGAVGVDAGRTHHSERRHRRAAALKRATASDIDVLLTTCADPATHLALHRLSEHTTHENLAAVHEALRLHRADQNRRLGLIAERLDDQ